MGQGPGVTDPEPAHMSYQVFALDPKPFAHLFGAPDAVLRETNAVRMKVDSDPGFPCRAGLRDLPAGGWALLVNHAHQTAASPYRASGPIFVEEGRETPAEIRPGHLPDVLIRRLLSLRAYDSAGMIVDAEVVDGRDAEPLIGRFLSNPEVTEIHAHFARRGCFAARILRA
jgi:hypothetical protein